MSVALPWYCFFDNLAAGPGAVVGGLFDVVNETYVTIAASAAIDGRNCLVCKGRTDTAKLGLSDTPTAIVAGFYLDWSALYLRRPFYLYNAAGTVLLWVEIGWDGVLYLKRGNPADSGGTTIWTQGLAVAQGAYVEVAVDVQATAVGEVQVQVDGVPVGDPVTGIITSEAAGPVAAFSYGGNYSYPTEHSCSVNSLYIKAWDGVGDPGFLGIITGEWSTTTSDVSAVMTPTGAATNYGAVADASGHDGDTTYVATETPGDEDEYGLADVTPDPSRQILAIIPFAVAQDPQAAGSTLTVGVTDGVDTARSAAMFAGGGKFFMVQDVQTTLPDGSALTESGVNALDLLVQMPV